MRYDLPLAAALARKWDALEDLVEARVIGRAGEPGRPDPRFRLIAASNGALARAAFYGRLPLVVREEIGDFRPQVIITQSPFEAFACLPRRRTGRWPRMIVEVHADWRTAARMYGSGYRRGYAALAERAAVLALRRADGVRTVSSFTSKLVREATGETPVASFPAFFDFESFVAEPVSPLPGRPAIAWVGALQGTKGPGLIAAAWHLVSQRVPGARLVVVGDGPLRSTVDELVRELPDRVEAIPWLEPREVAGLLDRSTALAMSSSSEGLGRVIMEAFLRGRPVVAPAIGGIPELVESERNGLLVPPGDAETLAGALVRVLTDRELAQRLANGAREAARRREWSPQGYAASVRDLVDRVIASPR